MSCKPRVMSKFRSFFVLSAGGFLGFTGLTLYKGDETFYAKCLMRGVHKALDPETAHNLAVKLASQGIVPPGLAHYQDSPILRSKVWDIEFSNPIGLAAGFDKNGEAIRGLSKMGFGFVECGSVTPEPQPGNDKPRIFRLLDDDAIINRCGFNSDGLHKVKQNLAAGAKFKGSLKIGLNLGKNKTTEDPTLDYETGYAQFSDSLSVIDYMVVNVSSPNTPGLRNLQARKQLETLIDKLLVIRTELYIDRPLLLKIAPDLTMEEKKDIAQVVMKRKKGKYRVDGIIVCNTTIQRPETLKSDESLVKEAGGLSGRPLNELSTQTIRDMYTLTGGKIPIIGVGGVFSGKDAYDKIRAGASLVQLYTALAIEGPPVVNKIKRELEECLRNDGLSNVSEAVGAEHRSQSNQKGGWFGWF